MLLQYSLFIVFLLLLLLSLFQVHVCTKFFESSFFLSCCYLPDFLPFFLLIATAYANVIFIALYMSWIAFAPLTIYCKLDFCSSYIANQCIQRCREQDHKNKWLVDVLLCLLSCSMFCFQLQLYYFVRPTSTLTKANKFNLFTINDDTKYGKLVKDFS